MNNQTAEWIQIAKQVIAHPFAKITCPDCQQDFLQILIVPWKNEAAKVDVHLICKHCNTRHTFTKEAELM